MDAHAQKPPAQKPGEELAPYATQVAASRGRIVREPPPSMRTEFQRDRDRIIHSGAFRKLRNKTQVFIESEGDYYRTRLTHSLEVAQIARSIARTLRLDEDLTEALALAHDLGHTCFGHSGEEGLAEAMKNYGGFNHNEQTFRILTKLENRYPMFDGLNLTWETMEGIIKHNGPVPASSLPPSVRALNAVWDLETSTFAGPEAQVAALADDIAYNTHDIDDGHRAGLFRIADMETLPLFGPAIIEMRERYPDMPSDRLVPQAVRDVIGLMINDLMATTRRNLTALRPQSVTEIRHAPQAVVSFSFGMTQDIETLRKFLHARVYRHTRINRICAKARRIVQDLFRFFMAEPSCLPGGWRDAAQSAADEAARARVVADYIAGMTDRFAAAEHAKLFSSETMG